MKEGEPGIQYYVRDTGPYARVGRVASRENCVWVNPIFERSGSILVKMKASSKGSTILLGLEELRLIDRRHQTGLKSRLCGDPSCNAILPTFVM